MSWVRWDWTPLMYISEYRPELTDDLWVRGTDGTVPRTKSGPPYYRVTLRLDAVTQADLDTLGRLFREQFGWDVGSVTPEPRPELGGGVPRLTDGVLDAVFDDEEAK